MSEDSYVEVSHEGWFSRIGSSFAGMIFGLVLLAIGVGMLWWNEGRSVKRAKALDEGIRAVVELGSVESVNSKMNGKLVHATGKADTEEILNDAKFGVETNALALRRHVEMFQWIEKKEKREDKEVGGGAKKKTFYSYDRGWRDERIKSEDFHKKEKYPNPPMPVEGRAQRAKAVSFGAYALPEGLVRKIKGEQAISPTEEMLEAAGSFHKEPKLDDGYIFLGKDVSTPTIGDLRIQFFQTPAATVSILAEPTGNTFQPYTTSNGEELNELAMGEVSSDEMFKNAKAVNTALTWGLRAGGFVLLLIGFNLIMGPLSVLADIIPFLGNIVGGITFMVSMALAAGTTSFVIAMAWIYYRPIIGVPLLVVTVGSFVSLFFLGKKR